MQAFKLFGLFIVGLALGCIEGPPAADPDIHTTIDLGTDSQPLDSNPDVADDPDLSGLFITIDTNVEALQRGVLAAQDSDGPVDNVTFSSNATDVLEISGAEWIAKKPGQVTITVVDQDERFGRIEVEVGFETEDLSVGYNHACLLTLGGHAYCWGSNEQGQLGIPASNIQSQLNQVPDMRFQDISAGNKFTCGVNTDSEVFCWGFNDQSQLGSDGPTSYIPRKVEFEGFPRHVTTGTDFACASEMDGVWCWGANVFGQCGAPVSTNITPHRAVSGLRVESVDAGARHVCMVAGGGKTFCWGSGTDGQNGDVALNHLTAPTEVSGLDMINLVGIAAGTSHTCGFNADKVYCWGADEGQLGSPSITPDRTPHELEIANLREIASRGDFTIGIRQVGAMVWGKSGPGLGIDSMQSILLPTELRFPFTHLDTGIDNSCGVDAESTLYCWGSASTGILGPESATDTIGPTPVKMPWD